MKTIAVMGNFRELVVWQKARSLAVDVYKMTKDSPAFASDFWLRDQMRRSAISTVSNIAEGDHSGSDKQGMRYFSIARGSAAELTTQLDILLEISSPDREKIADLINRCQLISSMLHRLMQARRN